LAPHAKRCRFCGAAIPPGQILLEQSGVVAADDNPPDAARPATTPLTYSSCRLASLGDRLLALGLDSALFAALWLLLLVWLAARWGKLADDGLSVDGWLFANSLLICLFAAFVYFWILEGLLGSTLGKAMVGLEVRIVDRGSSNLRASLLRNLLRIIDGLGLYLVGFLIATASRRRQRLGDHVARTLVVENPPNALRQSVVGLLWVATLSAAIFFAGQLSVKASSPPAADGEYSFRFSRAKGKLSLRLFRLTADLSWAETAPGASRATTPPKP